jgi:hypothetical protein
MTKQAEAAVEADLGKALRKELKALLDGGQAHATFDAAVKDFPAKLRGVVPEGLPYSGWQILEHLRLAQRDILEFSSNADGSYKEKKWPDEYWPKAAEPPSAEVWERSIAQVREDRAAFEKLIASTGDAELVAPFAWGSGQTLLREALLIADHDAYHVGELVVVRRLLGAWKK